MRVGRSLVGSKVSGGWPETRAMVASSAAARGFLKSRVYAKFVRVPDFGMLSAF
jgi:hypothetical protein